MFNGIEFWGIWRKEQQFAAGLFGNRNKLLFGMKGSIIHYDYGAFVKRRQKLIREPEFKKTAVHRSAILKRRKNLTRHLSSNNAATFVFSPADTPEYLLAPWRIPVFPIQVCIYAAFIHISNFFGRYVSDFFLIYCYFLLILLLVTGCLFFLVIL